MKTRKPLFVSIYVLSAGAVVALAQQHPMQGDCKGNKPAVCELVESDILPKQGHQGTHPAIHMSIKKKNTIHVVHTAGKDFVLDVNLLDGQPPRCQNAPNPFTQPMPYKTDPNGHVKEFSSTGAKKEARGCTYELWMTEADSGRSGDPHIFVEP